MWLSLLNIHVNTHGMNHIFYTGLDALEVSNKLVTLFQFQFISHNKRTKSSKELVRNTDTDMYIGS